MLLIQSDFIKSSAFVIFPIVSLIHGPVSSNSAFCQIAGFSLAVGIESSDIAVLLIALHSIMYIFRPRSGLYPYRRIACLVYYLFPVIAGCLAFIDAGAGYENLGHYCYLRTDTSWTRLALSWVPRYIIATSIVVIYVFVYVYVRKRMVDYGRRSSGNLSHPRARQYYDVPPTPPIAYHGLLSSNPSSRRGSAADAVAIDRQRSFSSASTIRRGSNGVVGVEPSLKTASQPRRSIQWNWSGFKQPASSVDTDPLADEATDPLSPGPPVLSTPPAVHSPRANQSVSEDPCDSSSITSPQPFWHRPLASSCPTHFGSANSRADQSSPGPGVSLPNILTMLRKGPPRAARTPDHPTTETSPILISPSSFGDESGVIKNREKIRRQLRSLLAYPLVYMIIWVFPFVSHVMGYDDSVRPDDPQWLLIVSIISLCIQGAVDCTLFTIREQPWKHAKGKFWTSFKKRLSLRWNGSWMDVGIAGRTREEMLIDGRIARERREEEIEYERTLQASTGPGRRKGGREWWDVEFDGPPDDNEDEDNDNVSEGFTHEMWWGS
jgi:G protein-coupled receptor GPR1